MRAQFNREKVLLVLDWCINKFGKSKYWSDFPKLIVYKSMGITLDSTGTGRYGQYNDGIISIYLGHNKTVRFYCNVVLHEYKHYLLNDVEWNHKYKQLKKSGLSEEDAMFKHPHEAIANKFADKWQNECYNDLKNKLYKK